MPAITGFFGALARKFSFPSLGALARKFLLPLGALTGLFGALALKFLLPLGALTASSARWRTSSFSLSAVSIPADHWNPEKAETAQSDTVTLMGVMINSRYGKHHELELMCRIIAALPPNVRSEIKLFWCDSKATCSYSAIVKRPLNAQTYEMVGREIHDAACSFGGDHNGIDVGYSCEDDALWGDDGHRYSVHPHWNGDASCG